MALKKEVAFESAEATATQTTMTEDVAKAVSKVLETANVAAENQEHLAANVTVIAPAQTAVAAPRKPPKFQIAFQEFKDVLDTGTVSALSMSAPRVTGEQGSLYLNRTVDMGKQMRLQVVSWNDRWAIGTGEKVQNDETKALFRISYDNHTIDGAPDVTVAEYIRGLKEQGYPNARVSKYVDLWGFPTWSKEKGDVADGEGALTVFQLSETSGGAWMNFCVSRGMQVSMGKAPETDMVEVHALAQESKGNKFTNMDFHVVKA